MASDCGIQQAAELFKALSSASRLRLLQLLTDAPATVGALVVTSELSQPLVSQHLRVLRSAGLVHFEKHGREAIYSVTDSHVSHIVTDAITHVTE
jgi:DNA-binding transcriptional ArsR family regulator